MYNNISESFLIGGSYKLPLSLEIIKFIISTCVFSYFTNVIINYIHMGNTQQIIKSFDDKETSISKSDIKIIGLPHIAYINLIPSILGAIVNSVMIYYILENYCKK